MTSHRSGMPLALLALMASIVLALACALPSQAAYADELGESFMVAAAQQDGTYVLAPTSVPYEAGDTVQAALERADIGIAFTQSGTIDSIAGVKPSVGVYLYYFTEYEGRESVMLNDVAADSITALFISSADVDGIAAGHVDLLNCMRTFTLRSDGLRNYPDAKSAYERAYDSLPMSTNAQAAVIAADFVQAIETYDAYMASPKSAVTFTVKRAGVAVNDAQVAMVDLYSNVTLATRTGSGTYVANVVPGIYAYQAMAANGLDGVRCTAMAVTGNAQVSADLPASEWFYKVALRVKSNNNAECSTNGTSAARRTTETVQNIVPDAVKSLADLSVYAVPPSSIENDKASYPLYAVYTGTDGDDHVEQVTYESRSYMPPYLVDPGIEGTEFAYEVRHTVNSAPLTYQVEICNASITRSPTLSWLSVREGSAEILAGFEPYQTTYTVYTSADELDFTPTPRGTGQEGYSVQVAGRNAGADTPVTVAIGDDARTSPMQVQVVARLTGANGASFTKEYKVNVNKVDASTVTIDHDADVSVEVIGEAGGTVAPVTSEATSSTYRLLAGHTYNYVSTKGTYFHAKQAFSAVDGPPIQAATPATVDAIESFKLGRDNLWGKGATAQPQFEAADGSTVHEARFLVPDYWSTQPWLRAYPAVPANASDYTYRSVHARQDTGAQVTSSTSSFKPTVLEENEVRITGGLSGFTTQSGYSNTATFTVTTGVDPVTGAVFTQDYFITAERILTLPGLSVSDGKNTLKMARADTVDDDNPVYGFDRNERDYVIAVAEGTESLQVSFSFPRPISSAALASGGYAVAIDGEETPYAEGAVVTRQVALDPSQHTQTIPVIVRHDDPATPDASYRLQVRLMPKVPVAFDVTPADASVTVTDPVTGLRINPGEDGVFDLISGYDYDYSVAARGYVGQKGSFMAHDGLETTITLVAAPVNPTIDTGLSSHWPYFRADSDNNGVVDAKTPIPAKDLAANAGGASTEASADPLLYWATQLGEGYDSGAAGCPILVDGFLYTYAGDKIYKLDTVSGEVKATGTMVGTSSFAITPMTYAEGMVFVALSNGRVEAFNAATLESLWVYTSPNGGQPNCPITYHDGCIYTGFWNWANHCDFVCLTVTDEDPTTPGSAIVDDPAHPGRTKSVVLDAKVALWAYQHEGGFYWAGAWAGDDYVLVGSDNAGISAGLEIDQEANATGTLFSFDPLTGEVIDTLTDYKGAENIGNIRSTVMRDAATGRFYFCGRGGYLCGVDVNPDGTFDKSSARAIRLQNNASDGGISSTSTPVVYNGRAYVGADHGSYNAYDGQSVDVVDLATGSVAYTVNMQGRAQTSGLLTTGYVDEDGYVYIYFIDNYYPGKLRCFKDKPGQTSPIDVTSEVYAQGGKTTTYDNMANVVFCPKGAQAQYCICSPIADEYGTIYFKNDSAFTMALGSPITKLEVTEQPTVTQYGVGETFEPAGMKVIATYANGATRDVTEYVEVSDEPFETEGVVDVPIVFPYTMYQAGPDTQDIGTAPDYNFEKPTTTVRVAVGTEVAPRLTTPELPHAQAPEPWAVEGTPYEVVLSATGAPREFTWTCVGDLPNGLEFTPNAEDGTASISGTPEVGTGGAYPITVTCTNSVGTAESELTLEVYEIPTVTSSAMSAQTGVPFSYQVQARGYPLPLVYGLQEGYQSTAGWTSHTPEGLSIDPDTGLISGTPLEPIDPQQYRMRVYASNAAGMSIPANLRISVSGESLMPAPGAPEITTEVLGHSLAEAETGYVKAGEQVEIPVEATGDPAPTITVTGLPEGLSYDAAAGKIAGSATAVDENGVAVTVAADNGVGQPDVRTYWLYVYEAPATSVEALGAAQYNEPYEQALGVTGAPAPNVIVTGLASGLHYDKAEGKVYGTPKMKGTFKVSVTATNAAGSFTKTYQLVVGAAPAIGVYALPQAREGAPYAAPLKVSGEPAPDVTVEGLPAGLAYNAADDVIAGTTDVPGRHEVTVTAANAAGSATKTFDLVVNEAFDLVTAELPHAVVSMPYEAAVAFSKPLTSANVTGLPEGLEAAVDAGAGTVTISGTPADGAASTSDCEYQIDIAATSARGTALQKTISLVVEPYEKAVSLKQSVSLFPWEKGVENSVDLAGELQASGRPSEFAWRVADGSALPAGLVLDSATGVLSGAPAAAGMYAFQVVCANGISSAQALVTLPVNGAPEFGALEVPTAVVGKAYSASVAVAVGVPLPTYSWQAVAGSSLPPGLRLDSATGAIVGTCTQRGIYTVEVTADNGKGDPAVAQVSIVAKQDIAEAQFDAIAAQVYNGRGHEPVLGVYAPAQGGAGSSGGGLAAGSIREALTLGVDYVVTYADNVNAGTASAIVSGAGLFTGSTVREFSIDKAPQSFTAKAAKKSLKVKYKKLRSKKQTTAASVKVAGAHGAVTYAKVKVSKKKLAKKFTVNKKTGKITIAKKTKKGTYKVTLKVTAAGDANYKAAEKTVVVKVVVK